jgi:hypothetical protein
VLAKVLPPGFHGRREKLLLSILCTFADESRRPLARSEVQVAPLDLAQLGGSQSARDEHVDHGIVLAAPDGDVETEEAEKRLDLFRGQSFFGAFPFLVLFSFVCNLSVIISNGDV